MAPRRSPRVALGTCLAAAAALLIFMPSLSSAWLNWDDGILVAQNPNIRGFSWEHLRWAFASAPAGAYQPVAFLSYMLDFSLWGADARGYHLTNALLHALCAALVFLTGRRLLALSLPPAGSEPSSALDAGALFAALLFAVHPLRVESVSWIAERRDALCGTLWVGAVLSYLRAREPGKPPRSLAATCALFTAACLAKGIAVTLPLVFLMIDAWPLRRRIRDCWREKLPLFALAAVLGGVAVAAQRGARASATWRDHGLAARLAQTVFALAFYARKTAWPSGLSPIYELRVPLDPLEPRFVFSAAAVAAFAVWAWRERRERPWWAAAGAASAIVIVPVGGMLQSGSQIVADRYSYLATLPWAILAGGGLRAALRRPGTRAAAAVGAILLASGLAAACVAQQSYWRDSESLWSRALALDPRSGTALLGLGTAFSGAGRFKEAEALFARAEGGEPACTEDLDRLAALTRAGGDNPEMRRLRAALGPRPTCRRARSNRAAALAALGDYPRARAGFESALAADPDDEAARRNLQRLDAVLAARPAPGASQ